MDKAPEAFKTISEAAEDLDVPQHVLRFWETRFSQIKPMKRGGGRRYYRPNDVDLLKGIRFLLYGQGYTIRGVQRILRENGIADVAAIGRGEMEPDAFAPPVKPENERVSKVVRAGDEAPSPNVPEPAGPNLDEAAMETLREALADLKAAGALLSSSTTETS